MKRLKSAAVFFFGASAALAGFGLIVGAHVAALALSGWAIAHGVCYVLHSYCVI